MNDFLKAAYDYGAQQALADAGIIKTAAQFGADATYGDLLGKHTPESRELSRTFHGLAGAGLGGLGGAAAGGIGTLALLGLLAKGGVGKNLTRHGREVLGLGSLGLGTSLGGVGGMYAGALEGTERSMENDPAMMRYMRGARRAVGLE